MSNIFKNIYQELPIEKLMPNVNHLLMPPSKTAQLSTGTWFFCEKLHPRSTFWSEFTKKLANLTSVVKWTLFFQMHLEWELISPHGLGISNYENSSSRWQDSWKYNALVKSPRTSLSSKRQISVQPRMIWTNYNQF